MKKSKGKNINELSISELKNKILETKLSSVTGKNKQDLLDIYKNITNYKNNKQVDYRTFKFGEVQVNLNNEQYCIVSENINTNMRIIACAGSGKTTTIVCRIKYLIDNGINPENIMLTTFNVDAAESMKSKIASLFGFMPKIYVGTIDSISCRFYWQYCNPPNKNELIGVSEYSHRLLDFLKSDSGHQIYSKIKYLFFDEFQDCSDIQFDLLKTFHKSGTIITVIGDDAQNIYQWRGSNIDFILNLNKYIPNIKTFTLVNNYRSTPEIINIANLSIKNNTDQIPKDMIANKISINHKPIVKKCNNDTDQANIVIHEIIQYILKHKISMDNIAVISRNNKPLKIIEEEIEKHNQHNKFKIAYVALITDDHADIKPKILKNHVTLTTIHKSKGLEWDVVFMLSCNDDQFPSELDSISIQEERRLFYVSVTRAKQYLHIYFTNKTVTRFVHEIPLENLNFINVSPEYFKFENVRNLKYVSDVTGIIKMIDVTNINFMRETGILPNLVPVTMNIHGNHKYSDTINKYYLHPDFGTFIDRYITRLIGQNKHDSGGLTDRSADKILNSIKIDRRLYAIYNKYQTNFYKYFDNIKNLEFKDSIIDKLDKRPSDPQCIKKIEYVDRKALYLIIKELVKKNKSIKDISVFPVNYIPFSFLENLQKSHKNYTNKNEKSNDIIYDIYNVSLCDNIVDGRRRLIYRDVFEPFTHDKTLFENINNFIELQANDNLICKKLLFDGTRDIIGEFDLLNLSTGTLIDFKCSATSEYKLEWIIQLLTYVALSRINDPTIMITTISIYNPMLGTITNFDIKGWNMENDLLDTLQCIRDKHHSNN